MMVGMAKQPPPNDRSRKYRHWKLFSAGPSLAYEKLGKRVEQGLCIGCGHKPCTCKNPRRRSNVG